MTTILFAIRVSLETLAVITAPGPTITLNSWGKKHHVVPLLFSMYASEPALPVIPACR